MTTHNQDKIIAAIKKATDTWTEDTTFIERFYTIAFDAGRQAEREERRQFDKRFLNTLIARGETK